MSWSDFYSDLGCNGTGEWGMYVPDKRLVNSPGS